MTRPKDYGPEPIEAESPSCVSVLAGPTIGLVPDSNPDSSGSGDHREITNRAIPVISGYEIVGELGRGGMGVVYRARQVQLNRPCALKMILAGAHANAEATVRFLAEAEAVARVQHPNVVQ